MILSALLALFFGALDTLIMGAAMTTIVSDLGGTIGIGISGCFVTARLQTAMDGLRMSGIDGRIHQSLSTHLQQSVEGLFRPEIQTLLVENVQKTFREAVAEGTALVFWASLITACVCLFFSYRLPE